jgi:hypothetical protein
LERPGRYTRLSWMQGAAELTPKPAAVTIEW